MTQSIPATTKPENVIDFSNENPQLEVDPSDWEVRMARLVGFVEESANVDDEATEDAISLQPSLSPSQEVRTEEPFSSNPFAKLGLVGTATLAIVLVAGAFLSQLMSGMNQKPSNNVLPKVRSHPINESQSQALEQEVETLKTKLALTEQVEDVKAAQQKLRTVKLASSTQLPSQSNVPDQNRLKVAPIQTVYVPRTMTVAGIARVPSLPPQLPVVKPEIPPLVNTTPPPPPNPLDEWTKLAKLGSYGQVSVTGKPNDIDQTTKKTKNDPIPPQVASVVTQVQQHSPKSIVIGTSAKAVLATAVFGEATKSTNTDKNENKNKNTFVVQLQEPLKAVDGTIAIPAKTELLTEISSVSEQGLLQLNVVKMVLHNQGGLTEQSLPPNAIVLRAPQGKPLIGQQFPNRSSSIASMDLGLFVLGGLGKAAELLNRTQSQVVTTTAAGTIISNSNPPNDIAAGLLEGGVTTIVPQISQRNQQAISQMNQRNNLWFLPAGTQVELYINQAISL